MMGSSRAEAVSLPPSLRKKKKKEKEKRKNTHFTPPLT
jgi:hypothetical protein